MRLFYDKKYIFSIKWVIKSDLHCNQRNFYVFYSVIFRYASMWVGMFACVIGVDVNKSPKTKRRQREKERKERGEKLRRRKI